MKKNKKQKNIVFSISGGVGKNIIATAVVNSIRDQYPDSEITVANPHTAVWKNNPDINAVIDFTEDDTFYKNYIKDKDVLFLANDPYLHQNYIYKREHLIETWCHMFNIKYNGANPKLYFTEEENSIVKQKLPKGKLFFIQVSGGAANQEIPISWTRDLPLPIAQKVVDHMKQKGYETVHIRRKDQYPLENAPFIDFNLREMLCSFQFADKLLLIDSVGQHVAAGVGKKSVVTWVGHLPEVFGYAMHTNIVPNAKKKFRHKIDSYLDLYNLTGTLHECPYDTNELFDVEEIKKALEE